MCNGKCILIGLAHTHSTMMAHNGCLAVTAAESGYHTRLQLTGARQTVSCHRDIVADDLSAFACDIIDITPIVLIMDALNWCV